MPCALGGMGDQLEGWRSSRQGGLGGLVSREGRRNGQRIGKDILGSPGPDVGTRE